MCSPSGTSPFRLYNISPSSTMTGLLSRIADLRSPLASAGVAGATTLRPGMCASQLSHACECCEESWSAAPFGPRNTIGRGICPPDMYSIRSEEHTSELQSLAYLVCRLLLEKKKKNKDMTKKLDKTLLHEHREEIVSE